MVLDYELEEIYEALLKRSYEQDTSCWGSLIIIDMDDVRKVIDKFREVADDG